VHDEDIQYVDHIVAWPSQEGRLDRIIEVREGVRREELLEKLPIGRGPGVTEDEMRLRVKSAESEGSSHLGRGAWHEDGVSGVNREGGSAAEENLNICNHAKARAVVDLGAKWKAVARFFKVFILSSPVLSSQCHISKFLYLTVFFRKS
jgi:hypothetical protein